MGFAPANMLTNRGASAPHSALEIGESWLFPIATVYVTDEDPKGRNQLTF